MVGSANNTSFQVLNVLTLVVLSLFLLFMPIRKEIWYDESISVLCSKGLYTYTTTDFSGRTQATHQDIVALNTPGNVLSSTIRDNGNSIIYNEVLHFFTSAFGNNLDTWLLLSKLAGILTLLAFYFFCTLLFGNSWCISLALILLSTNGVFWGMGHEIRAYELGMLMVTLSAYFAYRFANISGKTTHLFLASLFCVLALLTHYLSCYAVLGIAVFLLVSKKAKLFNLSNILAIILPLILFALYMYTALAGFKTMSGQNAAIAARNNDFSILTVVKQSLMFMAYNFRVSFPILKALPLTIYPSALFAILLYIFALRTAADRSKRNNLHLLFWLGMSGIVFQAMLAVKSGHATSLYARYYSFCTPFGSLFAAYTVYVLANYMQSKRPLVAGVALLLLIPSMLHQVLQLKSFHPEVKFNHISIAQKIVKEHTKKLVAPTWTDAMLVSAFMPKETTLTYLIDTAATMAGGAHFILENEQGRENVPIVRNEK